MKAKICKLEKLSQQTLFLYHTEKNTSTINKTTYTLLTKGFPGIRGGCIDTSGNDASCENGALAPFLNSLVKIAIAIAAVLAIVMLIIHGIQYMGDESVFGHTEAKDGMWKAILGLIIALGSYAILNTIDPALLGRDGLNVAQVSAEIDEEPLDSNDPIPANYTDTNCTSGIITINTSGGSFPVCSDTANQLKAMINDAWTAGVHITGYGFRTKARQEQLRAQNCGGLANVYKSSAKCNPPTAIPGQSLHQAGKAFDLKCDGATIRSQSNSCFIWLKNNAPRFYGFKNLSSEPWHWSTTGH